MMGRTKKFYFLFFFVNLLHMCAEFLKFAAVLTHSHLSDHLTILSVTFCSLFYLHL
jgi:hypothetical protein